MKQHLPNFITLLNLFFGCVAIVSSFQAGTIATVDETNTVFIQIPAPIFLASLYIGLAALMDFMDGFIARHLKVSSAIGIQLDSLADLVSFGLAPSCIVFQFLKLSLANDVNALSHNPIGVFVAFLIPMAGAYRLARFNLDKEQSAYFKGVPIPMIGMVTASFPLIYWQAQTSLFTQLMFSPFFWYAYIVLVSSLMVIKTPMLALKNIGKNKKLLLPLLLLVLEVMLTGVFFKWMAIPFGFIGYCLVSLIYRKTITQQ